MRKYKPITVIKWVFLFGFMIVAPLGWEQFRQVDYSSFDSGVWAAFLFVVIGTTFLAYLFNIYGLKTLNPSTVSTYIYSQPLIATLVAIIAGQDSLSLTKVIAALLIFSGVYLVSSSSLRKPLPMNK